MSYDDPYMTGGGFVKLTPNSKLRLNSEFPKPKFDTVRPYDPALCEKVTETAKGLLSENDFSKFTDGPLGIPYVQLAGMEADEVAVIRKSFEDSGKYLSGKLQPLGSDHSPLYPKPGEQGIKLAKFCKLCGELMTEGESVHQDCGGDCLTCMAEITLDPECIEKLARLKSTLGETEIAPCPFCKSTHVAVTLSGSQWYVECHECGATGPGVDDGEPDDRATAIRQWDISK